ncbi:hypothetical protein ACQPZP_07765 [Spirillospora sp. CA-142024]|uniref:hypothetical protein n=1 Tax=Spirillospora sp. CA-142024 TaxID=3240036 RepID=UPI003D8ABD04
MPGLQLEVALGHRGVAVVQVDGQPADHLGVGEQEAAQRGRAVAAFIFRSPEVDGFDHRDTVQHKRILTQAYADADPPACGRPPRPAAGFAPG